MAVVDRFQIREISEEQYKKLTEENRFLKATMSDREARIEWLSTALDEAEKDLRSMRRTMEKARVNLEDLLRKMDSIIGRTGAD